MKVALLVVTGIESSFSGGGAVSGGDCEGILLWSLLVLSVVVVVAVAFGNRRVGT